MRHGAGLCDGAVTMVTIQSKSPYDRMPILVFVCYMQYIDILGIHC